MSNSVTSFDYFNSLLQQIHSISLELSQKKLKLHTLESSFKINAAFPPDDLHIKLPNDRCRDAYILQQQLQSSIWFTLNSDIDILKADLYKLKCQVEFILRSNHSSTDL